MFLFEYVVCLSFSASYLFILAHGVCSVQRTLCLYVGMCCVFTSSLAKVRLANTTLANTTFANTTFGKTTFANTKLAKSQFANATR